MTKRKRLIDAHKLIGAIIEEKPETVIDFVTLVAVMPTESASPTSEWIMRQGDWGVCSNCHRSDHIDSLATHCRYCGARLKTENA